MIVAPSARSKCVHSSVEGVDRTSFCSIDPFQVRTCKCDILMTSRHGNGLLRLLRRVGGQAP